MEGWSPKALIPLSVFVALPLTLIFQRSTSISVHEDTLENLHIVIHNSLHITLFLILVLEHYFDF